MPTQANVHLPLAGTRVDRQTNGQMGGNWTKLPARCCPTQFWPKRMKRCLAYTTGPKMKMNKITSSVEVALLTKKKKTEKKKKSILNHSVKGPTDSSCPHPTQSRAAKGNEVAQRMRPN